jgi:PTS system nitrogen regulatory IIA component
MKLTLDEVAVCLDLPGRKVQRWISQGRIPIRQDGQICVFNETVLEKWAATHNLSFRPPNEKPIETPSPAGAARCDGLLSAMKRGGVYYNVKGNDARSVLEAASTRLSGFSAEAKKVLHQRLMEREKLMSTGVGKGVAIPHPRTPLEDLGSDSLLATFFLDQRVDFGAIDDKPVFVLFILLCPATSEHLNLLSRLAFCVRDDGFVSFLETAPDAEALFSKIETFEKQLD